MNIAQVQIKLGRILPLSPFLPELSINYVLFSHKLMLKTSVVINFACIGSGCQYALHHLQFNEKFCQAQRAHTQKQNSFAFLMHIWMGLLVHFKRL